MQCQRRHRKVVSLQIAVAVVAVMALLVELALTVAVAWLASLRLDMLILIIYVLRTVVVTILPL